MSFSFLGGGVVRHTVVLYMLISGDIRLASRYISQAERGGGREARVTGNQPVSRPCNVRHALTWMSRAIQPIRARHFRKLRASFVLETDWPFDTAAAKKAWIIILTSHTFEEAPKQRSRLAQNKLGRFPTKERSTRPVITECLAFPWPEPCTAFSGCGT